MKETVAGEQPKDVNLGSPSPAVAYFNGSSDRIDIPYAPDLNPTSFTVEMWVQFQGGIGYRAISSSVSGSASLGRRGYVFCVNPAGQWQFWLGSGQKGIPWVILTGPKAKVGVWTHLAGTYDSLSQTMIFYVNGLAAGQRTKIKFQPNDRHPLHVGTGAIEQTGASACFFHGNITKMRITSRYLSSVEIQTAARERELGDGETKETPTKESPEGTIAGKSSPTAPLNEHPPGDQTTNPPSQPTQPEESDRPIKSLQPVLAFDGKDDCVEIEDPFENNTTFTISLWVKPSALNDGSWHGIIGKHWGEKYRKPGLWLAPNNSALHYDSYSSSGSPRCTGRLNNFFEAKDRWVHITWVKEGTEYRFYRNGELFATKEAPESFYTAKSNYLIGQVDNFFPGEITSVSIWSIARTQTEIQKDMHRHLKGDEPGLAYYWAFNEGSGNTAIDSANCPNDGIIRGATWQQAEVPVANAESEAKALQPVLTFDGKDDYVEIKDPFDNNTTFTISLWVKPSSSIYTKGIIGKYGLGEGYRKPSLIMYARDELVYDSQASNGGRDFRQILNNFFAAQKQWVHITWVKEGTEYRIYRNGELFATGIAPESFYTSNKTCYWIGRWGANNSFFAGQMTELSVWSIARTQAEIQKDMQRRLKGDEPGLACYWALNEDSGNTAIDSANRPNHGTIKGATWQQSEVPIASPKPELKVPQAVQPVLVFDGQDDYVEIQNPFENNTTFTISLWVKPSVLNDGAEYSIFGKAWDKYHQPGLGVAAHDSGLYYNYTDPGKMNYGKYFVNFFEGKEQWVHLTWVKEGTEFRIYRNGELFATKEAPECVYTEKANYWIGRADNFFSGQITELSIWSVARTPAQIQKDMHRRLQGDEPGLAYYWGLNEGDGDTVHNKTKNANHGKISGASWKQVEVPIILEAI